MSLGKGQSETDFTLKTVVIYGVRKAEKDFYHKDFFEQLVQDKM